MCGVDVILGGVCVQFSPKLPVFILHIHLLSKKEVPAQFIATLLVLSVPFFSKCKVWYRNIAINSASWPRVRVEGFA